jgi:indole-3-glycerol phosphate synthase
MLEEIVKHKKQELKRINLAKGIRDIGEILPQLNPVTSLKNSLLKEPGVSLIAEVKRRSPSKGILADGLSVPDTVQCYEQSGAHAVSVLTDQEYFDGSVEDLMTARHHSSLPILRKDFIVDEFQVWESRLIGADAILLIAAVLTPEKLSALHSLALKIGLEVLVEVHTAHEIETVLPIKPEIIGINNRDLKTFEVNLLTTETLRQYIPKDIVCISESGIKTRNDILRLQQCGVDAVLVGEEIVTSPDPGLKIKQLLGSVS